MNFQFYWAIFLRFVDISSSLALTCHRSYFTRLTICSTVYFCSISWPATSAFIAACTAVCEIGPADIIWPQHFWITITSSSKNMSFLTPTRCNRWRHYISVITAVLSKCLCFLASTVLIFGMAATSSSYMTAVLMNSWCSDSFCQLLWCGHWAMLSFHDTVTSGGSADIVTHQICQRLLHTGMFLMNSWNSCFAYNVISVCKPAFFHIACTHCVIPTLVIASPCHVIKTSGTWCDRDANLRK